MPLELVKYHGLGNDFLVLVDWERRVELDAPLARVVCDRHRGIGADGLIRLSAPRGAASLQMELRNADGSVAETSGNGLRCAALAAVQERLVPGLELAIETLAGIAHATVAPDGAPGGSVDSAPGGSVDSVPDGSSVGTRVRVDMGVVRVGAEQAARELAVGATAERGASVLASLGDLRVRHVDTGNPHLVIYGSGAVAGPRVDVGDAGPVLEAGVPGGVNVELVTTAGLGLGGGGGLAIEVWERGAGLTLACGSGSCAAAAACRAAGLVGDAVEVANPGGVLHVELSGDLLAPTVALSGPAQRVARVILDAHEPALAGGGAAALRGRP